MFKILLTN